MPTIDEEVPEPHRLREVAESFGVNAELYDRARPRYPDALIQRIVAASPGPDILNVGLGTGIEARQFQATGSTVLGVEPDVRMADIARRNGVVTEVATFETWDPAGREFDAVVSGTAWHWIDPVAGASKAAQVLRPGGLLAIFWHVFQLPPKLVEAFATVYSRILPDTSYNVQAARQPLDTAQVLTAAAAAGIKKAGRFTRLEQWRVDWEQFYSRGEWLDRFSTEVPLTQLPPHKLAEVLDGVGATIDSMGGSFTMPCSAVAVTATRTRPAL